jgi:ribosomal RNA methyltransferase Nop2
VRLFADFKNAAEPGKSRKEYMKEFLDKVRVYYEYSEELTEYLAQIFPPSELVEFLEANETPKLLTIRTNTLKTRRRELAQALIQRGVNLDPVGEWSKVGLKIIESQVPIGATPEYLAGHYILQAASSFLPVMALAPRPGERVLDMCAAPGGKSSHLAQLMKNTGVLISNDSNKERIKALKGNLHRLGVTNCMLTNYDARKFPKFISGFDRILLDAPCSGLGVIFKDPSVKLNRTVADIKKNAHLQKELILAAIDCLNAKSSTGGFLVYSTCSVSVEENEEVVQYALTNRNVKLVETGLEVGEPGFPKFRGKIFDPKMIRCKRVYPHTHNMDGFFVAKLKKFENDLPEGASKPHTGEKRPKLKKKKQAEEVKLEGDEEVKLPKKRSREPEITEQAEPTAKQDRKRPKEAREEPADNELKATSKKRKATHREEVEESQPVVPKSTRRSRREEAEARAKARKKHR